jgi:hypothetical protein
MFRDEIPPDYYRYDPPHTNLRYPPPYLDERREVRKNYSINSQCSIYSLHRFTETISFLKYPGQVETMTETGEETVLDRT